jgi:hypothetical protein
MQKRSGSPARKAVACVLALVTLVCVLVLATAGSGLASSGHQYKGHCGHMSC